MTNDRLLGPSSDPLADLDATAGALIEACPHGTCKALTHAMKQYAGLAAALGTLYFDMHEQKEAREIVEELETTIKRVEGHAEWVNKRLNDLVPKLPGMRAGLRPLIQAAAQAKTKALEAGGIYRDHKREFVDPK
jgi:hypothetical protein